MYIQILIKLRLCPPLTNEESQALEGEITYLEALNVLTNMKSDKPPGSDGFTAELFKMFWADLGHFIVRSINYSYIIKKCHMFKKLA